ncbi:MAG: TIGR02757 family protein [Solirubrobacteraceae bacterium]
MNKTDLKEFLDEKLLVYNVPDFIASDPIQIPHRFTLKEDKEIASFLVSIMAWGKRSIIINKGNELMAMMDEAPFDFVMNHTPKELQQLNKFKHRTLIADDFTFFIKSLQNIYKNKNGLESLFHIKPEEENAFYALQRFRKVFFEIPHKPRSGKHIGDTAKKSAAKRLNMFLRWMVRDDKKVDIGIWKSIPKSKLSCPLDVHSGRVGRMLGLINSTQNNWKTVEELDGNLREMNAKDPVIYDFALFGIGLYENF